MTSSNIFEIEQRLYFASFSSLRGFDTRQSYISCCSAEQQIYCIEPNPMYFFLLRVAAVQVQCLFSTIQILCFYFDFLSKQSHSGKVSNRFSTALISCCSVPNSRVVEVYGVFNPIQCFCCCYLQKTHTMYSNKLKIQPPFPSSSSIAKCQKCEQNK